MTETQQWLSAKRDKLAKKIEELRVEIRVIDGLISDLPLALRTEASALVPSVKSDLEPPMMNTLAARKEKREAREAKLVRLGQSVERQHAKKTLKADDTTLQALNQAGDMGLTASELADAMDIPKGTASSRLSVIKTHGLARHDKPRYFAIHSTAEDNNHEMQNGHVQ